MATRTTKAKKATPTDYLVLRLAEVREEPVEDSVITESAWLPILELVNEGTADAGWQVKTFTASGKNAAIRQHTGEGPDVIEGTWKAIPMSSWKGGETTRRVTAAQRLPVSD